MLFQKGVVLTKFDIYIFITQFFKMDDHRYFIAIRYWFKRFSCWHLMAF